MVMLASQRLWRGRFVVVASLVLASFFTRADVFSHGPLRPKMDEKRKKSYRLRGVGETGERLRQVYIHKSKEKGGRDEVIELVWGSKKAVA